ncbi:MAG: Ig-like domain-containing protein, partial [Myxococcaceae bacterium]
GNSSSRSLHFTIDATPPVIAISGVADGQIGNTPVTPAYSATDVHLAGTTATLGSANVASGTVVSAEGQYTLTVTATDTAGNSATEVVSFTIDLTPPAVSISGVAEGDLKNQPVIPLFSAADPHLLSSSATLDGANFATGTMVFAEGVHVLVATAADKAGNSASATVHFGLDFTLPVLALSGADHGERRNTPATLVFGATDDHLGTVAATVDGLPIQSGAVISTDGPHEWTVSADDLAGNTAQETRQFTIDTHPPTLALDSPQDGLLTKDPSVAVTLQAADDGPLGSVLLGATSLSLGLDGLYHATLQLTEGANLFEAQVFDAAGNSTTLSFTFTRDSTPPLLTVSSPGEGDRFSVLDATVSGEVTDASAVTVTVNGAAATVSSGAYSAAVTLTPGGNTLEVVAVDALGNQSTVQRSVRANTAPPALVVTEPEDGLVTASASITVAGTAYPGDSADSVTLTLNGQGIIVGTNGSFTTTASLSPGAQTLAFVAIDGYGLRTELNRAVTRQEPFDAGTPPVADAGSPPAQDSGTPPPADAGTPPPPYDAGTPPPADAGGPPAPYDAGVPIPAPLLFVEAPSDNAVLGGAAFAVTGRIGEGSAPFRVTVNGASASVAGSTFAASLALPEGAQSVEVEVTDALNRTASASLSVTVDRTPPVLTITRPGSNPAAVAESPFRLEGTAGDVHLAGVTIDGSPVVVLAGGFSAAVPLQAGNNSILIEARDSAGNRSSVTQVLQISGLPPVVAITSPADGSSAQDSTATVTVHVTSSTTLASVQVGTGPATPVGANGDYTAQVQLALGDNLITASATDTSGLSGTASIHVTYLSPAVQPLLVTGVSPQAGAVEVEPDVAVSVAFNKAIAAGQDLSPLFTVKSNGVPLPGGYFIAPGQQTVTFMVNGPLPVGERIQVSVAQVQAAVGPGQGPAFTSDFTVRPPLTILRGLVMDERFQPLKGVKVTLEGQSLSTETGVDGNWALFGTKAGPAVARFDGVTTSEGLSYPTVRRRFYVTSPGDTQDTPLILYPTDTNSVQPVDATSALRLTFGGREKDPVIDVPANGLAFADGTTHGFLTATLIPRHALPVKIEGHAAPAALWQLAPAGTWLSKPVTLSLPNRTNLPPWRLALILAYDNSTQVMKRVAFGRVSADGSVIVTEAQLSVPSLEFFGYMPLSEAQSTAVASAMGMPVPGSGTSTDGGLGLRQPAPRRSGPEPSPWRWVIWALGISEAHAQSLLGMFGIGLGSFDGMVAAMEPAMVQGTVRAPREDETFLTVVSPDLAAAPTTVTAAPYHLPVTFTVKYESNQPTSIGTAPSALVSAVMTAKGPGGGAVSPPAGGTWTQQGAGEAQVSSQVQLGEGTTTIYLSGSSTYDSTSIELAAKMTKLPSDGGADSYLVSVKKVADSSEGTDPLANLVRFSGAGVEVTGATDQLAVTNAAGHYGTAIMVPPGEGMAIACTSLPTGPRAFTRVDA